MRTWPFWKRYLPSCKIIRRRDNFISRSKSFSHGLSKLSVFFKKKKITNVVIIVVPKDFRNNKMFVINVNLLTYSLTLKEIWVKKHMILPDEKANDHWQLPGFSQVNNINALYQNPVGNFKIKLILKITWRKVRMTKKNFWKKIII